jgi:tRNA threonylcarbamoyladenosine biosynthesis protein TsaB
MAKGKPCILFALAATGGQLRVLAVDTTTGRGSVAVVAGGEVLGEVRLRSGMGHSKRLMPAVAFLLDGLGISAPDVEGYAVTAGPGSFTGLRVGLSCVQGLALASGRPCLGLCTLDVLAARIVGAAPTLAAAMDAHRGEVYACVFESDGRRRGEPVTAAPAQAFAGVPPGTAFIGDGATRYREEIRAAVPDARFPDRSAFLAGTLGLLAEPVLAAGGGVAPAELRPLYLRGTGARAG